ncbi:MAG: flagellar motor protein MotB [Planctomycetota bacterium]|jgi:chemotaxis protein MotB
MESTKTQVEADEPAGAPEWMVTFSDCMTLLLTFFVLLLSFSSFDENIYPKFAMHFARALYSDPPPLSRDQGAFSSMEQFVAQKYIRKGSEKPTLAKGEGNGLKEETKPADFRKQKVFLISSKKVFWGKGTAISSEGRNTLATMASFLKEVPSRIIISENGPGYNEQFGLLRAWAVMEYLTTKQGLNKRSFSISATSTLTQEGIESGELGHPRSEAERGLEIVLLERSIYN